MTRFYLIRHGETEENRTGRYQGFSAVALNEIGQAQVRLLAGRLADLPFDVIYSSDLPRAVQTARMIARGRTVALDPRLREINVGRVQGLTDELIARQEPEFWAAVQTDWTRTPYPGGESPVDLHRRAVEALDAYSRRYPGGRVAVVTHGALISLLAVAAQGLPLTTRRDWLVGNASLTELEWSPTARGLIRFNDRSHLGGSENPGY